MGAIPLLSIVSPHPQGQRKGANQPQHRGSAGQGSTLRTRERPRRNQPHGARHFTYSPVPTCSTASAGQRPHLCSSPTFGPSEKQLVGGIQAEHRLGVSFCHGDALQRGCPGILGATHRVNDAPCVGKKEQAWWGGVEGHGTTQSQGHGRARAASPQASSTARQCNGPLHLTPARLSRGLCGNPGNLPRSSPCLLPLP